jgi:AraC-like DNA-binding protein
MSRLELITDWPAKAWAARYKARLLARLCMVSPSQLRRFFVKTFGMSPQRWLNEFRLSEVTRGICSGQMTVKEAASLFHFADEAHLCHQFKRRFGCSPLAFALQTHANERESREKSTDTTNRPQARSRGRTHIRKTKRARKS